jgi:hypothetical protein
VIEVSGFWYGAAVVGLFVAALFLVLGVLAVCLTIDHYESGGRAKRDLQEKERP